MTQASLNFITYEQIKFAALLLPEVMEATSYGTPALKVNGKLMVRLKEDNETVVLRVAWEERERLVTLYPKVFFVTDHYRNHPWVLLCMSAASTKHLNEILLHSWRQVASKTIAKKYAQVLDSR